MKIIKTYQGKTALEIIQSIDGQTNCMANMSGDIIWQYRQQDTEDAAARPVCSGQDAEMISIECPSRIIGFISI